MNTEELNKFLIENRENYSIQLKRLYPEFFNEINESYNFKTFGQKIFHFLNGDDVGYCEVCGKECKFDGIYKGYRKTCSYRCNGQLKYIKNSEIRECVICNNSFEVSKKNRKSTCSSSCLLKLNSSDEVNLKRTRTYKKTMMEKYGVEHVSKLEDFNFKTRKTKLKNHGSETYVNPDKAKETKLEKYGSETYVNPDKAKETKLKKYGDENFNNRPKARKTLINKYGKPYSPNVVISLKRNIESGKLGFGSDVFLESMRNKYGSGNCMKNYTISNKAKTEQRKVYLEKLYDKIKDSCIPMFTIDEYFGNKNGGIGIPYKFQCNKCNSIFEDIISNGKFPRCLNCFPYSQKSLVEDELFNFIKNELCLDQPILRNVRSVINPLELDIYVPDKKIAIEFNGIYWHSELNGKDKRYHLNKTEKCESEGIRLIHIFENEWVNNKEIVKSRLRHIFDLNKDVKIHARKCEILEISSSICSNFLRSYHLQGSDKSSIKLGLFYNKRLVSVMTFGKKRIALGNINNKIEEEYELYRFCTSETVVGAAGKLLSFFIKRYNPKSIVSYADRRYSKFDDSFYKSIGFSLTSSTQPNYWYFYKSNALKLYHRFNFRKSTLKDKLKFFDENLTEWQNMQLNGYDRIWDCGHMKYIWNR